MSGTINVPAQTPASSLADIAHLVGLTSGGLPLPVPKGLLTTPNIWRVGSSNPSGSTGANGDFYLNTTSGDVFGPKANGAWGAAVGNLRGPEGPAGSGGGGSGTAFPSSAQANKVTATDDDGNIVLLDNVVTAGIFYPGDPSVGEVVLLEAYVPYPVRLTGYTAFITGTGSPTLTGTVAKRVGTTSTTLGGLSALQITGTMDTPQSAAVSTGTLDVEAGAQLRFTISARGGTTRTGFGLSLRFIRLPG